MDNFDRNFGIVTLIIVLAAFAAIVIWTGYEFGKFIDAQKEAPTTYKTGLTTDTTNIQPAATIEEVQ